MKVALTTVGKFHTFDLARQLAQRAMLAGVVTGYPKFMLTHENVEARYIHSFPWLRTPYMALARTGLMGPGLERRLTWWALQSLDRYAAARLPVCEAFVGLSGVGLMTGRRAKAGGAVYVCDRGSSHIRVQDALLREEYARHGLRYDGIDPRKIEKEEAEYALADAITVPSRFAKRTFVAEGVPEEKIHVVPYGVSLSQFSPSGRPDPERFDVLFVGGASLRKGMSYLLEGFAAVRHPRKQLTLVGTVRPEVRPMLDRAARGLPIVRAGHCAQSKLKEIMSRSHVLVMPSIEEGLALVQAQSLACGCPVIGTTNSGAEDLFDDGVEGFVVPIRDAATLADRMQRLADDPALQRRMAASGLARVAGLGGWDRYGDMMTALLAQLCGVDVVTPFSTKETTAA